MSFSTTPYAFCHAFSKVMINPSPLNLGPSGSADNDPVGLAYIGRYWNLDLVDTVAGQINISGTNGQNYYHYTDPFFPGFDYYDDEDQIRRVAFNSNSFWEQFLTAAVAELVAAGFNVSNVPQGEHWAKTGRIDDKRLHFLTCPQPLFSNTGASPFIDVPGQVIYFPPFGGTPTLDFYNSELNGEQVFERGQSRNKAVDSLPYRKIEFGETSTPYSSGGTWADAKAAYGTLIDDTVSAPLVTSTPNCTHANYKTIQGTIQVQFSGEVGDDDPTVSYIANVVAGQHNNYEAQYISSDVKLFNIYELDKIDAQNLCRFNIAENDNYTPVAQTVDIEDIEVTNERLGTIDYPESAADYTGGGSLTWKPPANAEYSLYLMNAQNGYPWVINNWRTLVQATQLSGLTIGELQEALSINLLNESDTIYIGVSVDIDSADFVSFIDSNLPSVSADFWKKFIFYELNGFAIGPGEAGRDLYSPSGLADVRAAYVDAGNSLNDTLNYTFDVDIDCHIGSSLELTPSSYQRTNNDRYVFQWGCLGFEHDKALLQTEFFREYYGI